MSRVGLVRLAGRGAAVALLLLAGALSFHESTMPEVLGRYSAVFATVLGSVVVTAVVLWIAAGYPAALVRLWSLRYRFIAVGVVTLLTLGALELAVRGQMALSQSAFWWYWGTDKARHMVKLEADEPTEGVEGGYTKFTPNTVLEQGTLHHRLPTRINNMGFRGADWDARKAPGVFRIICLGGSSTFGYGSRDGHTYPDYLERILTTTTGGAPVRFEVLNLGMPLMNSRGMQALFHAEVLGYEPDVVTVYEGANDTVHWTTPTGSWARLLTMLDTRLAERSLSWALVSKRLAQSEFHASAHEIEAQAAARAARYVDRVADMADAARQHGARLVIVTQQMSTFHFHRRPEELTRFTYGAEVARYREEVKAEGGTTSEPVARLLVHARIVEALHELARRDGVPLVDGIAALDARRDVLTSWVHLTEEGNELLATAMAGTIRPLALDPPPGRAASASPAPHDSGGSR